MDNLRWCRKACVVFLICAATASAASAQTFTTLVSFNGTNGWYPDFMSLVQGTDGNLYGATLTGGRFSQGTVFKVSPSGILSTLYSFCARPECRDGIGPSAGLVLATDGNFYGTTQGGGDISCSPSYGCGTVFRVTPQAKLSTLHTFEGTDGQHPNAALVQGIDGNLYGTTEGGGANGQGTVFRLSTNGVFTILHSFCAEYPDCPDGIDPFAGLIQATDGSFYGTTYSGGDSNCYAPYGCGTVFKITTTGTLTTIHAFHGRDGASPEAGLTLGADGNLYGTTSNGGDLDCAGGPPGCGTVFKISLTGGLATLYAFNGVTDGASPSAGLSQGTDGSFYGTTFGGPEGYYGTIFRITPAGAQTTLQAFCDCAGVGANPSGAVVQATNGDFFGTTSFGGADNGGTVYSLDIGLGPFVTFVQATGRAGSTGQILGQGFTGATSVSFNGTPASFTVVSDTYIKATVPTGATTGDVTVTTPTGVLTSNVPFRVIE